MAPRPAWHARCPEWHVYSDFSGEPGLCPVCGAAPELTILCPHDLPTETCDCEQQLEDSVDAAEGRTAPEAEKALPPPARSRGGTVRGHRAAFRDAEGRIYYSEVIGLQPGGWLREPKPLVLSASGEVMPADRDPNFLTVVVEGQEYADSPQAEVKRAIRLECTENWDEVDLDAALGEGSRWKRRHEESAQAFIRRVLSHTRKVRRRRRLVFWLFWPLILLPLLAGSIGLIVSIPLALVWLVVRWLVGDVKGA